MSVNKVTLIGRLGQDPEMKFMANGDGIANFSIATSENWKDKDGNKKEKTEWHNIVAYKKLAEIIGQYVKKGSLIYIEGKLQTRKWEKDGVTHYMTEIVANEMKMLGGKNEKSTQAEPQQAEPQQGEKPNRDKFEEAAAGAFDDDIPFN